MAEKTSVLDQFQEELRHLKEAESLLLKLWIELNPYSPHVSQELMRELHKHFKWDDSE